jgi:hypothetical protein
MSKVRDPYDIWQRNERKKTQFAELYGKKLQDQAKPVHFPTKFTKFGEMEEKPVNSRHLERFYAYVDQVVDSMGDREAPVSKTNPNSVFKKKKGAKLSESKGYPPWDTPGVDLDDIL